MNNIIKDLKRPDTGLAFADPKVFERFVSRSPARLTDFMKLKPGEKVEKPITKAKEMVQAARWEVDKTKFKPELRVILGGKIRKAQKEMIRKAEKKLKEEPNKAEKKPKEMAKTKMKGYGYLDIGPTSADAKGFGRKANRVLIFSKKTKAKK